MYSTGPCLYRRSLVLVRCLLVSMLRSVWNTAGQPALSIAAAVRVSGGISTDFRSRFRTSLKRRRGLPTALFPSCSSPKKADSGNLFSVLQTRLGHRIPRRWHRTLLGGRGQVGRPGTSSTSVFLSCQRRLNNVLRRRIWNMFNVQSVRWPCNTAVQLYAEVRRSTPASLNYPKKLPE